MDRRIDVDRARREAKALLRAARAGDPEALGRMRPDRAPCLADAQHAVARAAGEPTWPALVRRADADAEAGRALLAAARAGDAGEVYALLESGAPTNARDAASGGTALHLAAAAGHVGVVDVLVAWVRVDRDAHDAAGRSALDVCGDRVVGAILRSVGLASDGEAPAPRALGDEHGEEACEADVAWLRHLAGTPGAETRTVGDGLAVLTGDDDNTRHGVVCSRLAPEEADATIAELLARFAARARGQTPSGGWRQKT